MTGHKDQDRGLQAVRRVRAVRERDSRLGLQRAIATARKRDADEQAARDRVEAASEFSRGTAADFQSHVAMLTMLASDHAAARARARSSRTVADEADRRWRQDRQAVRVVELLLERRAERRLEEQRRREGRELDDLAGQGWLRNRPEHAGGGGR